MEPRFEVRMWNEMNQQIFYAGSRTLTEALGFAQEIRCGALTIIREEQADGSLTEFLVLKEDN